MGVERRRTLQRSAGGVDAYTDAFGGRLEVNTVVDHRTITIIAVEEKEEQAEVGADSCLILLACMSSFRLDDSIQRAERLREHFELDVE